MGLKPIQNEYNQMKTRYSHRVKKKKKKKIANDDVTDNDRA